MVLNYCPNIVGEPPFAVLGGMFIFLCILLPQWAINNWLKENNEEANRDNEKHWEADKVKSISFTWRYSFSRMMILYFSCWVFAYLLIGCLRPPSPSFYVAIFLCVVVILIAHINGEINQTYLPHFYYNASETVRVSYELHSLMAFLAFGGLLIANFFLLLGENEYGQFTAAQNAIPWLGQSLALFSILIILVEFYRNRTWTTNCSRYERVLAIAGVLVLAGCPSDPRQ